VSLHIQVSLKANFRPETKLRSEQWQWRHHHVRFFETRVLYCVARNSLVVTRGGNAFIKRLPSSNLTCY